MQPGTPLAHEDAARLFMSTRQNPMVVTAVLTLDGPVSEGEVRKILEERLLVHERFRDRIDVPILPLRAPRWREVERFDLDRHVSRVVMHEGQELEGVVSELASLPLDPKRPAWRLWIVDGSGPGTVLVLRIHHAIADGVALLGVLFGVSDEGAGSWTPTVTGGAAPKARGLALRAVQLGRTLARRADAPRALAGRLGTKKRVAWSQEIRLEEVKRAAHAADARVNDVMLAALTGAMRTWLSQRGSLPHRDRVIHALVPVTLPGDGASLGNHYVSVFVPLPIQTPSRLERVRLVSHAMHQARAEGAVSLGQTLIGVAGTLGGSIEKAGVRLFSRKASVVASNVPGPPLRLHLCGRTLTSIVFASPAPGRIALSASFFSYAGSLRLTVAADARLVPDPGAITREFEEEVRAIERDALGAV